MEATSSYMVWTGDNEGDIVKATKVLCSSDTVSFLKEDKIVRTYPLELFLKYNPDWKLLENTE